MQGDLDTGHWQLATNEGGADYMQWTPNIPQGLTVTGGDPLKGPYTAEDLVGRTFTIDPNTGSKTEMYVPETPTTYDPNSVQTNFQGYKYFYTPANENYNAQTYYIDPSTNKPVRYDEWDVKSPFMLTDPKTRGGGFDDWITENGWMIPAAMIGAGAGATFGAGGAASELAGPTYGELGITGVEGGFAGPTYAEMGYTGLNQADAIAAADAASKGLTGADALNYVNKARQAIGTANNLAKLLGGAGGKTSTNPQQLASLLGGQSTNYVGQIKGNQNPFLFTSPGQTQATEGTYDVSGSNLANALRKA